MSNKTFQDIIHLLDSHKISYQSFEHEPTRTSEIAAAVREKLTGVPKEEGIKRGAKAMIVKADEKFVQLILSAALKIDFEKVKVALNVKKVGFARPEDVEKLTTCVPGSVPPFGNLFGMEVIVDPSLFANDEIHFNAGELTRSIVMKTEDWKTVVKPRTVDFTLS